MKKFKIVLLVILISKIFLDSASAERPEWESKTIRSIFDYKNLLSEEPKVLQKEPLMWRWANIEESAGFNFAYEVSLRQKEKVFSYPIELQINNEDFVFKSPKILGNKYKGGVKVLFKDSSQAITLKGPKYISVKLYTAPKKLFAEANSLIACLYSEFESEISNEKFVFQGEAKLKASLDTGSRGGKLSGKIEPSSNLAKAENLSDMADGVDPSIEIKYLPRPNDSQSYLINEDPLTVKINTHLEAGLSDQYVRHETWANILEVKKSAMTEEESAKILKQNLKGTLSCISVRRSWSNEKSYE